MDGHAHVSRAALALVQQRGPQVSATVAGDGPDGKKGEGGGTADVGDTEGTCGTKVHTSAGHAQLSRAALALVHQRGPQVSATVGDGPGEGKKGNRSAKRGETGARVMRVRHEPAVALGHQHLPVEERAGERGKVACTKNVRHDDSRDQAGMSTVWDDSARRMRALGVRGVLGVLGVRGVSGC